MVVKSEKRKKNTALDGFSQLFGFLQMASGNTEQHTRSEKWKPVRKMGSFHSNRRRTILAVPLPVAPDEMTDTDGAD